MVATIDRRRGILDDIPLWVSEDMDAWAAWIREYRDGPRGGGGGSIAWAMMQAKLVGIAPRGTQNEPQMPADLAAIDTAVGKLPAREKKAFTSYYLHYASSRDKARWCHCDPPEFYRRVKRARRTIADYAAVSARSRRCKF